MPLADNNDICYYVTKHSAWRGKYKRIFSLGNNGISTYDPDNLDVTNTWSYNDVISLKPSGPDNRFTFSFKKDKSKKTDSMIFSSEHRSELITYAYKFKEKFPDNNSDIHRYEAHKLHWSGTRLPVLLSVTPVSIDQLDTTGTLLATYSYKDIEYISDVSDVPGGFVISCYPFSRKHLFICGNKEDVKQKIKKCSNTYLSIDVKLSPANCSVQDFVNERLGLCSDDKVTTSFIEFTVDKMGSLRHKTGTQRLLCLSHECILERDPETYHIVTIRPLHTIFCIIRNLDDPRHFSIEYKDSSIRSYQAPSRDSLLATLFEAARASGNRDVHVKIRPTNRAKRFGPYHQPLDEEVETIHLRLIRHASGKKIMSEFIERFNCNVPYSGLTHSVTQEGLFKENKEKPILEALISILTKQKELDYDPSSLCEEEIEALFQILRRLFASKVGFASFTQVNGLREGLGTLVVKSLKKNSEPINHAAIDMICALMHPMHDDYDLKQEQLNKSSLLFNSNFLNSLLDMWVHYVSSGTGALVVSSMLDLLTFCLCLPYSETTEGKNFDTLLGLVARRGRYLFKLFQHPCVTIVKGASMVMRAVIEEGELDISSQMQELALTEGALPRHLISSLYTPRENHHSLAQCKISQQLVALWLTDHENATNLLSRIFPKGLLAFLESTDTVPVGAEIELEVRDNLKLAQIHAAKNQRIPQLAKKLEQLKIIEKQFEDILVHWGAQLGYDKKRQDKIRLAPVVLRKSRQRIKSTANWPFFYYNFHRDHSLANLIWNHQTREELRMALDKEVRAFESDRELSSGNLIAWNYAEFEVSYPSLKEQLCIDGYYIRILLDKQEAPESLWNISPMFFNNLYHRFLLPTSLEMKCMCLQALAIVYSSFHDQIGYFPDTKFIVGMLDKTFDRLERDKLIYFLFRLSLNKENVKQILDSNGVSILVDLMTLGHLHTSRAIVPTQSNVIEAGDMKREEEKEWHYCVSADNRVGPITFKELQGLIQGGRLTPKSKCWAQGMDTWQSIQIVPQIKWSCIARGNSTMNESDLAILILNILLKMSEYYPSRNEHDALIWPMSKLKQLLSSPTCLPHIVQLLLTFEPVIVEKVASLLCFIVKDNVLTPKLYLTGVFYFILMYTGSNVLPIAKFLQLTHTKQAFRGDGSQLNELMQRSILGQLLPEAMVHYLENHGAEKFAHIFLGEFDTPEAIWNSEMRRLLIEKIASHLADFSPRLRANNRAQYQYAGIPIIRYPQLERELFCNIFYLRHLCDESKFPDWPINDPVNVMRDVLEAWKGEVERKPPVMSVEEAYAALELPQNQHHEEQTIRKAYYRLAQKYHPDKNIEGREKFEMVNKAYEFLCSKSSWSDIDINTNNILLILKTQTILFKRYSECLKPYKYAGYYLLVKTIELEMTDDALFSKKILLLPAAVELVYYSVNCSALNAEELNRENGFQAVLAAFGRCVSVLSESTKDSDPLALVCLHSTHCFSIGSSFNNCMQAFVDMPQLVSDLIRILYFKNLVRLCCSAVECISCLSFEPKIQEYFIHAGVLWYLISFMFSYDFTLEECGIERTQEQNQQEAMNELAKISVACLATLTGANIDNNDNSNRAKVRAAIEKILTPYVTNALFQEQPHTILKMLTCNSETPYLIWDNSTRAELLEFLESKKFSKEFDISEIEDFTFSSHSSELVIGNIFIRVYNAQPSYQIEQPKEFIIDLLDYIKTKAIHENFSEEDKKNLISALLALTNVVSNNPGSEIQCIGHFRMLFSLLKNGLDSELQHKALSLLIVLTRNQDCISDVAASNVVIYLVLLIYSVPNISSLALDVLYALVSSSNLIKELLQKGCLLYLINIIVTGGNYNSDIKIRAAEILGKMCEDKVSGPRVKLLLQQYLPPAICDALRDAPSSAVTILHSDQENPEIIWNEDSRKSIAKYVNNRCTTQYNLQKDNPNSPIQSTEQSCFTNICNTNELIIGGVYLRLFNMNPNWSLRKPIPFLNDLFDYFVKVIGRGEDGSLDAVGIALTNLLSHHSNLVEHVPSLGHLHRVCIVWQSAGPIVSKHITSVMNIIANSETCVNSLVQSNCLQPLKRSMSTYPELISPSCELLSKLFQFKKDYLVKQAVEVNLIQFLLGYLNGGKLNARTKALIVQTLKAMCGTSHGASVKSILDNCPAWSSYRDQNHDLFISSEPQTPTYLMGVPSPAGYLTQGTSKTLPSSPPPVDKETL